MNMKHDIYDQYREPPQGCGTAIAGGLAALTIITMVIINYIL